MTDPQYHIGQTIQGTEAFGDVEIIDMFWSQHSKTWAYEVQVIEPGATAHSTAISTYLMREAELP